MPETLNPQTHHKAHHMPAASAAAGPQALRARQTEVGLLNLRGDFGDSAVLAAVQQVLGGALAVSVCSISEASGCRVIWAGPDEWLLLTPAGQQAALAQRLGQALSGHHHAVTDVSSGFFLVDLAGPPVRDTLAQGCPIDVHPRAFPVGRAVGTHFYKVGLTLWLNPAQNHFQMLVRRSFIDHFWQLIDHASVGTGRADF